MKHMKKAVENKIIGNAKELEFLMPGLSYHSTWDNPETFAKYIENLDGNKAWHRSGWEEGKEFYGTENMEEALSLAKKGWALGADQVESLRNHVLAKNPVLIQPVRYGIVGAYANVPRAIAGDLMNMRAVDLNKSKRRPVITLLANMCANWTVPATQISNRAAVVAAIIDQIEAAGYSCEVISTALAEASSFDAATSVIVKKAGQPVDTARLAYALGHASFFRRLVFADWGTEQSCKSGLGQGLGHPSNRFDEDGFEEKKIYTIPSANVSGLLFKDAGTASTKGLKHIIDELSKQGCPAFSIDKRSS